LVTNGDKRSNVQTQEITNPRSTGEEERDKIVDEEDEEDEERNREKEKESCLGDQRDYERKIAAEAIIDLLSQGFQLPGLIKFL
jgi:hypothetical protein